MTVRHGLAVLGLVALTACEIPVMIAANANDGAMTGAFEVTLPAVLLIQIEDGSEEYLTGEMRGKASGNAQFDLTGPVFGDCTGSATRAGQMQMTCSNGYGAMGQGEPARASMSGVVVSAGTAGGVGYRSAFGWGRDANEAAVRSALAN